MGIKTVLKRIERAEQVLKTQSIFSQDCICFPEKEQPSFHWRIELEIAVMVKCPLHGDRFKPLAMFYVAEWLRKKREWFIATRRSAQYQKAWRASFPPGLVAGRGTKGRKQDLFAPQGWVRSLGS